MESNDFVNRMDSKYDGSSSHPAASGGVQSWRCHVTVPAMQDQSCWGKTSRGEERCVMVLSREPREWPNVKFELICNSAWGHEHLKPIFEDLADGILCRHHKAQLKDTAEWLTHRAWVQGWITESRTNNNDEILANHDPHQKDRPDSTWTYWLN